MRIPAGSKMRPLNLAIREQKIRLTKSGRGKYTVQSVAAYEKQLATVRLLSELTEGAASLRGEGGLLVEEAFIGLDG